MLAFLFSSGGFGTCAMSPQAVPLHSPYGVFVKLLHPFAPHIAEEMWSILGVFYTKAALEKLAMENERMKEFMAGKTVVKSIVVPGKLVNIVVK